MKDNQLRQLTDKLQKIEVQEQCESKSFLDIIHKSYSETYVTEILAYLLNPLSNRSKSNYCVKRFIEILGEKICDDDEVQVMTNKYAWGGYIDLFVYIPNKLAIVVENKIWSGENGGGQQTQRYYEYCEKVYGDVTRKYVLLKPNGNFTQAYCNRSNGKDIYKTIYYKQLVDEVLNPTAESSGIDKEYDHILSDFLEHCNRRFVVSAKLLDPETQFYLENINAIKQLKSRYEYKLKIVKNIIFNHFTADNRFKAEKSNADNTYRFYIDDWFVKHCFYLYFEIKFDDGNINNTKCQITIKKYDARKYEKERNAFYKILNELDNNKFNNYQVVSENWYVYFQTPVHCEKNYTVEDFAQKAIEKLEDYAVIAKTMGEIIKNVEI